MLILQVNEFPDFLSGEERDNAQHIVIKYLTDEPKKGKRQWRKKSARSSQKSTRSDTLLSSRNSIAVDRLAYSAREPASRKELLRQLTSRSLPEKRVQFGETKSGLYLTVPGMEDEGGVKRRGSSGSKAERTRSLDTDSIARILKQGHRGSESLVIGQNAVSKFGNTPRALPQLNSLNNGHRSKARSVEDESSEEESYDGDVSLLVPPLDLKRGGYEGDEDR